MDARTLRYRVSRRAGRAITRLAAIATLGRIPPFVSTSAIVCDADQVLVVIDPIRKEPILPGGHLSWRETPEAAAVREVREETGIEIAVLDLLGVFTGVEWAGEPGIVRVVYTAQSVGGTLTPSGEGEPRWMAINELAASNTRDAPIVRHLTAHRGVPVGP